MPNPSKADVTSYLLPWLKDAHAMEMQNIEMMERQIPRLKLYPALAERYEQHLTDTRAQAVAIETCLEELSSDVSRLKNAVGRLTGSLSTLSAIASAEEVVKATAAAVVFARQEIAHYRIVIAAADYLGLANIAETFTNIVVQEVEMAEWLELQLGPLTQQFLENNKKHPLGRAV